MPRAAGHRRRSPPAATRPGCSTQAWAIGHVVGSHMRRKFASINWAKILENACVWKGKCRGPTRRTLRVSVNHFLPLAGGDAHIMLVPMGRVVRNLGPGSHPCITRPLPPAVGIKPGLQNMRTNGGNSGTR